MFKIGPFYLSRNEGPFFWLERLCAGHEEFSFFMQCCFWYRKYCMIKKFNYSLLP
jgi:hypothetical protein